MFTNPFVYLLILVNPHVLKYISILFVLKSCVLHGFTSTQRNGKISFFLSLAKGIRLEMGRISYWVWVVTRTCRCNGEEEMLASNLYLGGLLKVSGQSDTFGSCHPSHQAEPGRIFAFRLGFLFYSIACADKYVFHITKICAGTIYKYDKNILIKESLHFFV